MDVHRVLQHDVYVGVTPAELPDEKDDMRDVSVAVEESATNVHFVA